MINKTNIKVPKKYQSMIEEIEKTSEDGYWIYAKTGYYFSGVDYGIHLTHEQTQKHLLEIIRSLKQCACKECNKYWWKKKFYG